MKLNVEISTAAQVRELYGSLSEHQKEKLELRDDYSVELRIKVGRKQAIGSVVMNADIKFEQEGGNWATVQQRETSVQQLPTELVLHLIEAAFSNEIAQKMVQEYFGEIPKIDME